ncbi:hypothetical protein J6590_076706 [Homalodisca vitripennis]|nr:hypothetical protein J6590_076706 [Homalodisca vitripennis]
MIYELLHQQTGRWQLQRSAGTTVRSPIIIVYSPGVGSCSAAQVRQSDHRIIIVYSYETHSDCNPTMIYELLTSADRALAVAAQRSRPGVGSCSAAQVRQSDHRIIIVYLYETHSDCNPTMIYELLTSADRALAVAAQRSRPGVGSCSAAQVRQSDHRIIIVYSYETHSDCNPTMIYDLLTSADQALAVAVQRRYDSQITVLSSCTRMRLIPTVILR